MDNLDETLTPHRPRALAGGPVVIRVTIDAEGPYDEGRSLGVYVGRREVGRFAVVEDPLAEARRLAETLGAVALDRRVKIENNVVREDD